MVTSEPLLEEPGPARSRLSAAQEAAIFEATLQLVAEVGFDLTSIDEIARRARASKATLYRRWKGKTELVFAALLRVSFKRRREMRAGASLREDLLREFGRFCARATTTRDLILGLSPVFRSDPERTRVVYAQLMELKQETAAELLGHAVVRGELPAMPEDLAKIVEVAESLTYHRLLMTGAPLDAAFVTYVVDSILLPLIHTQFTGSHPPAAVSPPGAPQVAQAAPSKGTRAAPRAPRSARRAASKP